MSALVAEVEEWTSGMGNDSLGGYSAFDLTG